MCRATPKGSYGEYLYIGCWEVEQESTITTAIYGKSTKNEGSDIDELGVYRLCQYAGDPLCHGSHLKH